MEGLPPATPKGLWEKAARPWSHDRQRQHGGVGGVYSFLASRAAGRVDKFTGLRDASVFQIAGRTAASNLLVLRQSDALPAHAHFIDHPLRSEKAVSVRSGCLVCRQREIDISRVLPWRYNP